jgi:hypothetical protein
MASTKVKPISSGAATTVTGNGKTTTGMPDVLGAAYQLHLALLAVNVYQHTGGTASQERTWATKHGTAAGITLSWA